MPGRDRWVTPLIYARLFLFLPLLVGAAMPVLTGMVNGVARIIGVGGIGEVAALLLDYLIFGSWMALIPYALFVALVLSFLRNRSAKAYFRYAPIAPIAWLPFFGGFIYFTEALGRTGESFTDDAYGITAWSLITLPFSYAYVGLFFLGARVLFGTARPRSG